MVGSELTGDTTVETKAPLKVVRTRVKRILVYSMTQNAIRSALPWTVVAKCISKGAAFCSYLPAQG